MSFNQMELGQLIKPAKLMRAGNRPFPILSMTMHAGLVDQADKFKKRVASTDTAPYKVVRRNQLVVGFPIDEGVLSFQELHDEAIVSPAYDVWDIRDEQEVGAKYLERFLRSPRALAFYASKLRGTTARRRTLPDDIFLSLLVPVPPMAEQRRIADVLDRAEALRAKRRAALAQLDTLTQSIFLDLFGDPTTNPKGWPVRELQEIVQQGTIVTYGIVQAGKEFPSGVPYIRTGDIVDGEVEQHGLRHTDPAIAARFTRSRVEAGDIVMSIRATVGTTAVVPPELAGANLTQGTARIAPGGGVDRTYLLYYLRASGTQHWIALQIKGATFREITLGRLRQLPVQVPPMSSQCEFSRRAAIMEKLKTAHRASLAELNTLFAVLQHRAFRGDL